MDMAKQRGNQIKGDFCLPGSQLEKAVKEYTHDQLEMPKPQYKQLKLPPIPQQ